MSVIMTRRGLAEKLYIFLNVFHTAKYVKHKTSKMTDYSP